MVEYLAHRSGNKFVRINNHEHTDLQEYLGSYASDDDGKLRFKEGVLVDALRLPTFPFLLCNLGLHFSSFNVPSITCAFVGMPFDLEEAHDNCIISNAL